MLFETSLTLIRSHSSSFRDGERHDGHNLCIRHIRTCASTGWSARRKLAGAARLYTKPYKKRSFQADRSTVNLSVLSGSMVELVGLMVYPLN